MRTEEVSELGKKGGAMTAQGEEERRHTQRSAHLENDQRAECDRPRPGILKERAVHPGEAVVRGAEPPVSQLVCRGMRAVRCSDEPPGKRSRRGDSDVAPQNDGADGVRTW